MNAPSTATPPRPLLVSDVMSFARSDCSRCHGAGHVTRIHHANRGPEAGGEVREVDACSCAVKRFKKRHGADVIILNGVAMWKPGHAPVA